MPDFRSRQAKVRRKVCGLQGSLVFDSSLRSIEIIPHWLSPQTFPFEFNFLNHELKCRSVKAPKGASASFRPFSMTCTVRIFQSISPSLIFVNSDNLRPLSTNMAIIALSRILFAASTSCFTCSIVRLGRINLPSFGALSLLMGLGRSYSFLRANCKRS